MSEAIKVITGPSVYLVGRQVVDEEGLGHFLADEGVPDWTPDTPMDGETLVEVAGRLCYMSFKKPRPGGSKAYLSHILEVGHGSVLEHEVFNLILTGVSRSFTHELVRHRAGFGYSQLSQRFVDESDVAFVLPPAIPHDPNSRAYRVWVGACIEALDRYRTLADAIKDGMTAGLTQLGTHKQVREAARSVLPNCTETKIFVTGNARAWRHFCEMRSDPGADAEMRRVAVTVLRTLREASPNVFGDYVVEGQSVTASHRKV